MRIYNTENVFDAGLNRMRYIFDEFPEVIVGISGGKDSTVTLEMALIVAREKNRLPLKVMFLDQEAEWSGTIDTVREIMYREEVDPLWFQIPMVITNNASSFNRYSYCWNEEKKEEWIHPKDPISLRENRYGTDRFHDLFGAILKKDYPGQKVCYLAGVRAEENPKRLVALTLALTYKHISWAKRFSKQEEHYTFYPLYDWSYTDIWKAIFEHKWKYNLIYDEFYKKGVHTQQMRISNLHHETSVASLMLVQEIEPETWEKIRVRIDGANTIKHLKNDAIACPKELPPMFSTWVEYAEYLTEAMVQEEKNKKLIRYQTEKYKKFLITPEAERGFSRVVINSILASDWDLTKIKNYVVSQDFQTLKNYVNGTITKENFAINKKNNRLLKL